VLGIQTGHHSDTHRPCDPSTLPHAHRPDPDVMSQRPCESPCSDRPVRHSAGQSPRRPRLPTISAVMCAAPDRALIMLWWLRAGKMDGISVRPGARRRGACPAGRRIRAPDRRCCQLGARHGGLPGDGPRAGRLARRDAERSARSAGCLVPGRSYRPGRAFRWRAAAGLAAWVPVPTADHRAPAASWPPSAAAPGLLRAWPGSQGNRGEPARRRA